MATFNVEFVHTKVERICIEVDADNEDEARRKAEDMTNEVRAVGPWSIDEDFVSVNDIEQE